MKDPGWWLVVRRSSPILMSQVPSLHPDWDLAALRLGPHFLSSNSEEMLLQMCSSQPVCLESADMFQRSDDSQRPRLLPSSCGHLRCEPYRSQHSSGQWRLVLPRLQLNLHVPPFPPP
uniref:Uncharacterized protein n=1 Tax=Rangifer tarandus platyrhynchus TaxID=3082113 RepID=A0ACB0F9B8_RANTA|nr:unnamed protein product [Rangifer tarandus platyrhynchus]